MADPIIKLKRSAVYGKIPTPGQLPLGEVALNTYDGYLYASKDVGAGTTVIALNPFRVGTGTDSYNAYFTAGNIGIGSTQPSVSLDVVGDAHITGVVTATAFIGGIYIDESEDDNVAYNIVFTDTAGAGDPTNPYHKLQVDNGGLWFNPGTNYLRTGKLVVSDSVIQSGA